MSSMYLNLSEPASFAGVSALASLALCASLRRCVPAACQKYFSFSSNNWLLLAAAGCINSHPSSTTRAHTHPRARTRIHTRTHILTHARTSSHTHAHTHPHTHSLSKGSYVIPGSANIPVEVQYKLLQVFNDAPMVKKYGKPIFYRLCCCS